jgi:hypothetical protein
MKNPTASNFKTESLCAEDKDKWGFWHVCSSLLERTASQITKQGFYINIMFYVT